MKKHPGFIINYTTIAVDFWPRHKDSKMTHYFLTHSHTDHTDGLDSDWNDAIIYCSEITKKLLIDMFKIRPNLIVSLEMNQSHIMKLDSKETFNVTLLDANHCPGAVMYLFEGYFGTVLATGDFRYSPNMFIESPLENARIDICYLDNTYLNPQFANIPSRKEAVTEIIELIQCKKKKNSSLIFSIILKNLGKEDILVELARHFQTKILVSTERYQRLINVLELDEANFTTKLTDDTLIYAEDEHANSFKISKDKKIIHIKPSALEYICAKRPKSLPVIIELYSKSISTYYNVPYTDHSSYNELIEFVKKLKPKLVVPIVKDFAEKDICNTDISVFNDYLNISSPLKAPNEEFLRLLSSSTKVKAFHKIFSEEREPSEQTQRKLRPRNRVSDLVLHEKRYLPSRRAKVNRTQIEYESSPEKCSEKRTHEIEETRVLRSSVRKREILVNQVAKISTKERNDETEDSSSQLEDQDEEETIKSYSLRAKTFYDKPAKTVSSDNSACESKWKKLNQEVYMLEGLIGMNTSLNLDLGDKRSEQFERDERVQTDQNAEQLADDSFITNDLATNDTHLSSSKQKSDSRESIRIEHTQGSDNESKNANADISRLDISISSIEEDKEENNDLRVDKEKRSGSKDIMAINEEEEAVIATDKQLVKTSNSNNKTTPTGESIETTTREKNAFLNCFTASLNKIGVATTQDDYSDKFLTFLKNSFRY